MTEQETTSYSIQEYLVMEEQAEYKSEYEGGKILAMSGGTYNHSLISTNIAGELREVTKSKKTSCIVANSDLRVYIDRAKSFVYPDSMLICEDATFSEHDPLAITNPVLIVEVLSASTEGYDRGDKFQKYCSLPSFKEYVLIDQYKPVVNVLYRADLGYWKMISIIGLDKSVYIHTLDCAIPMSEIYLHVVGLSEPLV